jgi:hypothetical protein
MIGARWLERGVLGGAEIAATTKGYASFQKCPTGGVPGRLYRMPPGLALPRLSQVRNLASATQTAYLEHVYRHVFDHALSKT